MGFNLLERLPSRKQIGAGVIVLATGALGVNLVLGAIKNKETSLDDPKPGNNNNVGVIYKIVNDDQVFSLRFQDGADNGNGINELIERLGADVGIDDSNSMATSLLDSHQFLDEINSDGKYDIKDNLNGAYTDVQVSPQIISQVLAHRPTMTIVTPTPVPTTTAETKLSTDNNPNWLAIGGIAAVGLISSAITLGVLWLKKTRSLDPDQPLPPVKVAAEPHRPQVVRRGKPEVLRVTNNGKEVALPYRTFGPWADSPAAKADLRDKVRQLLDEKENLLLARKDEIIEQLKQRMPIEGQVEMAVYFDPRSREQTEVGLLLLDRSGPNTLLSHIPFESPKVARPIGPDQLAAG